MMLNESFLGIAPEAFQAVDVDLAPGEVFAVINLKVPETAEHESIVASEFIGVDDRASLNRFHREIHKGFGSDIPYHLDLHPSIPFEEAKDGDLASGSSHSFTLASSSEIRFIHLNLS